MKSKEFFKESSDSVVDVGFHEGIIFSELWGLDKTCRS